LAEHEAKTQTGSGKLSPRVLAAIREDLEEESNKILSKPFDTGRLRR
jgi:hypothetical protein